MPFSWWLTKELLQPQTESPYTGIKETGVSSRNRVQWYYYKISKRFDNWAVSYWQRSFRKIWLWDAFWTDTLYSIMPLVASELQRMRRKTNISLSPAYMNTLNWRYRTFMKSVYIMFQRDKHIILSDICTGWFHWPQRSAIDISCKGTRKESEKNRRIKDHKKSQRMSTWRRHGKWTKEREKGDERTEERGLGTQVEKMEDAKWACEGRQGKVQEERGKEKNQEDKHICSEI